MKHTLFIFALLTATIQTFAQSPRIKLNQITKDSVTGSVLISSPTDSGMVYSRDLFISYGVSDTVLILGGDTLAATSGIISSVLSDGVTITGNGTLGSELTADTSVLATLRALSDSLALVISSVTADNVTITGDGTVGSPLTVDTATVIASVGRLLDSLINVRTDLDLKQDQLNGTGFVKASGTTITYDNSTYLTSEVDGSVTNEIQDISTSGAAGNISISSGSEITLNVDDADASASNELQTLSYNSSTNEITLSDGGGTEDLSNLDLVDSTRINATGDTAYYYQNGVLIGTGPIAGGGGGTTFNNISETVDTVFISDYLDVDTSTLYVDATNNRVGIGISSPFAKLDVLQINSNATKSSGSSYGMFVENDVTNDDEASYQGYAYGTTLRYKGTAGTNHPRGVIGYNSSAFNSSTGTVDNMAGFYLDLRNVSSGTITNAYGARIIDFANSGGGTITNKYGFLTAISTSGATNAWNIYASGNAPSYFNGSVGIGTTSPSYKLHVNGSVAGVGAYNNLSDVNWKKNIQDINYGLDKILKLKPITFNWLNEDYGDRLNIGFIAQEVEEIIPNMVTTAEDGTKSLAITDLIPVLTKAIQEQQAIIETQSTEIEQLKTLITDLSNRLQILENN